MTPYRHYVTAISKVSFGWGHTVGAADTEMRVGGHSSGEVGPSANSQLVITHRKTKQSNRAEIK